VRPEQHERLSELGFAVMPPTELGIRHIALVAIRKSEIVFARVGHTIELVLRELLGEPVTLIFGEVELPRDRVPVHSNDLPDSTGDDFHVAAIQIDAADLGVGIRRHADVAGSADLEVEPVIRPHGQKFPPMRLVFRQIAVDHGGLERLINLAFDVLDLRYLRQLGNVQRPIVEGDAVWPVQAGEHRSGFALSVAFGDGIDLVGQPGADENGSLVTLPQRAGIHHPGGIHLDVEAIGRLELVHRDLVCCGGERGRCYGGKLLRRLRLRPIGQCGLGRGCRQRRRSCSRCVCRRRAGALLGHERPGRRGDNSDKGAGNKQMPAHRA
jgi:hypothetical protein